MSNETAYYIVIPGRVRTDKSLNHEQMFLYGEIASKCNQKGYCWASNEVLCELMGITERTLQRNLLQLRRAGHIRMEYFSRANGTDRHIWLVDGPPPPKDDAEAVVTPSPPRQKSVHTPAKNGDQNNITVLTKVNTESSAPSRGGDKTPSGKKTEQPKVKVPPRPHWQAMIDAWHQDYKGRKNGEVPTIKGRNLTHFGKLYDLLQERAKRKRKEWTEEHAVGSLQYYLKIAYTDDWLSNHWLLGNLVEQYDAVYAREATKPKLGERKAGPPAGNEGPSAHIDYLLNRYSEGNLDPRVILPLHYDYLVALEMLTLNYYDIYTGSTVEERKVRAVLAWLEYQKKPHTT